MMDFDNILDLASQNQGLSNVQQKRYSLQAGPPKKDPKSKGVNPAAVQALLKKQHTDSRKQELEKKKQKEDLLAKRVELKSDRKARAMASRTKDNFKGYNGIPVVEGPKKRVSKLDRQQDNSGDVETFRNNLIDPLDDEDNYEYEKTDSEQEEEPEVSRPGRTTGIHVTSSSNKSFSKKPSGPPKPAPPTFNFADLLKLAEKKQFEPVDLKPKVVKKDERLRTADEIRELEMERKARRLNKNRDSKVEMERDCKSQSSSSLVRKSSLQKEQKLSRPQTQKNSFEKSSLSNGLGKKPHPALTSDSGPCSSKAPVGDRERNRDKVFHSDRERSKTSIPSKIPSKAPTSQVSVKQAGPRPSSAPKKSSTSSDLSFRKDNLPTHQREPSGISGNRPSSTTGSGQQTRPIQGSSLKHGSPVGGFKSAKGEPLRPGNNSVVKSNNNVVMRSSLGGPSKPGGQSQGRPGGNVQTKSGSAPQTRPGGSGPQGHSGSGGFRPPGAGPGRPGSGGLEQGRPAGSIVSGPGRPKCTVVSETISSKNVGGPRPGVPLRPGMQQKPGMVPRPGMQQRPGMMPRPGMQQRPGMVPRPEMQQRPGMVPRPGMQQRPGMVPRPEMQQRPGMVPRPEMQQRPGMPPRSMMNRPPGPMLPPITSAYKRKYEDEEEEYDPEMDDFIDDGGDEQEEISRHIREIFGYDRSRYRDESDYALKFMESSWKDMQKEEARSLKMAVQEDLEEEKREEEEMRKKTKRKKI